MVPRCYFLDVSGRGFNSTYRATTSIYSAFGDTSNHYSTITEASLSHIDELWRER